MNKAKAHRKRHWPKDRDRFREGKYRNRKITEVADPGYIQLYAHRFLKGSEHRKFCFDVLKEKYGYIEEDGRILSPEEWDCKKERERVKAIKDRLKNGHHLNEGARVEVEVKLLQKFRSNGRYGPVNILILYDRENRALKYIGPAAPEVEKDQWTKVRATVAHDVYMGKEETKLKRIKIIH